MLVTLAGEAAAGCPAAGPVDTTRWIFANHSDFYVFERGSREYLSGALLQLLRRNWRCEAPGEVCAVDAYPWTNTQDGDVLEPITYRLVSSTRTRAVVEMAYTFGWPDTPERNEPVVSLIALTKDPESGCWVMDDLVGAQGRSLRNALEEFPYDGT